MIAPLEWLAAVITVVFLLVILVAPFTVARRYFSPDARRRARDAAHNMYGGPPGDPLTGAPFDRDDTREDD